MCGEKSDVAAAGSGNVLREEFASIGRWRRRLPARSRERQPDVYGKIEINPIIAIPSSRHAYADFVPIFVRASDVIHVTEDSRCAQCAATVRRRTDDIGGYLGTPLLLARFALSETPTTEAFQIFEASERTEWSPLPAGSSASRERRCEWFR